MIQKAYARTPGCRLRFMSLPASTTGPSPAGPHGGGRTKRKGISSMPNHVTTRCVVTGSDDNISQFRDKAFPIKEKIMTFDFNAFIPMPRPRGNSKRHDRRGRLCPDISQSRPRPTAIAASSDSHRDFPAPPSTAYARNPGHEMRARRRTRQGLARRRIPNTASKAKSACALSLKPASPTGTTGLVSIGTRSGTRTISTS